MDRPEIPKPVQGGILLDEEIDPMEIQETIEALTRLRASLRSSTLRGDVQVAIDRIGRIRILKAVWPGGQKESA